MDYMAYSHMFMANEEANENIEYNLPNFQLEWKKLFRTDAIVTATADDLPHSKFHWLNFLKSSAWLALAGISLLFATVTHAQTASTSYVITNGSCLRVREDANLNSRILDCLPNRTQIQTTEIINGFARLSRNRFVSARWIGSTPNNRPVNPIGGTGGQVNLTLGSRGAAVTEVQRALGVQQTGYYGPTTTRVVREFQARNNLRVDGIVGPQTRSAIFRPGNQTATGTGGQVNLSLGSSGAAVTEVQRALGVQQTGYYGPTTTRVVREFQARNNLRVDGIVGPQTRSAIFRT
ncbi:peptidoglycan-binding domain-containing protein [Nodularia sp. NIES-3585]|uniref:peptidoglycan-binding domain-containing protein n=1 Tax=Nodularia sp. NIES-3585 TaxID=1973477 RepID=UPI000B67139F|nr:peptidoglycan-binding protein [Nodularia sp. NIES-3585]GAX38124.1 peptidoglycan-binding domain 1 [Nodularia sp. NIES-3585]